MATSPFLALASTGYEETASAAASRCAEAAEGFATLLGPPPLVVVWVLSPADWRWFTPGSVYGMPHYSQGSLYLAGGRTDFWDGLAEEIAQRATPDLQERFRATYPGAGGKPDLTPFFDLLAVHELVLSDTPAEDGLRL